ncbi:MAG: tRNA modification GTPase [Planctomycetota bacterium]
MLERLNETIVAISSAPGRGPVGIVRLSGAKAIEIVGRFARLASGKQIIEVPGSNRVSGEVLIDDEASVPAEFLVWRGPRSYTREDVVEIHTIGSPPLLELIRQRAVELGAVAAQPGEFTARAFLNGAMDLSKAEAVAGLIRAQSDTQLRAAHRMMEGHLSVRVAELRDALAVVLALVEAGIDFVDEPIEFIRADALYDELDRISRRLSSMTAGSASVERLTTLPVILLFGRPNAGKSTLMNRLSGTSRAIVAAVAGTTRDILSAPIQIGKVEALLLDSAGVDQSPEEIIAAAREMTLSTAEHADLVCAVLSAVEELEEQTHILETVAGARVVIALNKIDAVSPNDVQLCVSRLQGQFPGVQCICPISAKNGVGLDELRTALAAGIDDKGLTVLGEALLMTERQRQALADALTALQRAVGLVTFATDVNAQAELLAFELREAAEFLGVMIGAVTTEDLLGQIFSKFCIGK